MLVRLLGLLLLSATVFGADFAAQWPAGTSQKLTYQMTTYPGEAKNEITLEVTKSGGELPTFNLTQIINLADQQVTITSVEKYIASGLRFVSSDNYFKLPEAAKAQLGSDSILVSVKTVGDSVEIIASNPAAKSGKMAFPSHLTTAAGALLTSRDIPLKVGAVHKYNIVNFLNFSGQPFMPYEQVDSIIADTSVTTPAGTFKCFKVRNSVGQRLGYTYLTTQKYRLPVRIEVVDPASGALQAKVELMKVE